MNNYITRTMEVYKLSLKDGTQRYVADNSWILDNLHLIDKVEKTKCKCRMDIAVFIEHAEIMEG